MSRQNQSNHIEYRYLTCHRGSNASYNVGSIGQNQINACPSETSALLDVSGGIANTQPVEHRVRKRSSAAFSRINSLAHIGGVNSIENFARSWTRAAGFIEVTPQQSFIIQDDHESARDDMSYYEREDAESSCLRGTPHLRENIEAPDSPGITSNNKSAYFGDETNSNRPQLKRYDTQRLRSSFIGMPGSYGEPISSSLPQVSSPPIGSYGTSCDALQCHLQSASMENAGRLWRQQQVTSGQNIIHGGPSEREPVLLKQVEQDGKIVLMVAGQSTLPQTIFNSTNVLIGIGLLSLPLGFRYAGWIFGVIFLSLSALVTFYTAKLLAKCMDTNPSLITFADIAFVSFGEKARTATSLLFGMELTAANVGSIVLFADTLNILLPSIGLIKWKIICGFILIPFNLLPLRLLSFSSFIGILSCLSVLLIIFIDGFIKSDSPGSLRKPAKTNIFPVNWLVLPLSFGLFMSPWGGHSIFPNIYRDMRHPQKYTRAVKLTFTSTYFLNLLMAVTGILMFGDGISNEISGNIINTHEYPKFLTVIFSIFIAIIPLTKIPLNCSPVVSTLEGLTGLKLVTNQSPESNSNISPGMRYFLTCLVRVGVIVGFVLVSILFPSFDNIVAFMGSALCVTISIVLPLLFYLKIFNREISTPERFLCCIMIVIASIVATLGTVAAFLPKSWIGAEWSN